ncbi:hypothetical protein V500_02048 [Pseudogymnoascus sp. VKM F-4518 (FW-2643)]|nr:hypothetical protein V500_02048 [Pseudogymnoascus sp. VKM F-4518 (FW-2643)]
MATPGVRWRGLSLEGRSGGSGGDRGRGGRDWRGGGGGGGNRGNRGGGGWNGAGRGGNVQQIGSRLIEQGERYQYGDNCAYSHNISSPNKHPNVRLADTPQQQRDRKYYNSWKRLVKKPPTPNDTRTIELLWNGALTILNEGGRDWKQMLPRDLEAKENYGREHIKALLIMVSHTIGRSTFLALAQPFLSVITHPAMLDCLSVNTFVGGLYNFISGSNGTRAVPFFRRLCANLDNAYCESNVSRTLVETTLITMLISLREILKREQRVAFHEELPDLINSLQNLTEATGIDNKSAAFQVIVNQTSEIRAIIARANGLLADMETPNVDGVSTTVVKSTYRQITAPGGHHDNDNWDITKVKILPTTDEIKSGLPEFLPSTDPDKPHQPHFLKDPVARHLDTQFRLLRHDIFGELKKALGGLINTIADDPNLLDKSKLSLGDIRAYPYTKAYISYVFFKRNRGIEAHVSFSQPHALRKKSATDRRKWWEDSKRLEEGSLLCFVSFLNNKSSLLFLTVSEKCTDPKASHSLSSQDHISTIVTKLATRNQGDLELLIQLSCQSTQGALIEFPGILLATFLPILENLQNMHRFGSLPFRQWILPDRHTISAKPLDIPPPLYARGKNFHFPLDSILKADGDQLNFDPGVSIDDVARADELEARTSLDRGQCLALMAALTREFTFIQGPPGTGKSYLGVQIMSVLLACKEKADLGPVVVVCYTNHALDQFLEHLIEIGINNIIRIGGQSKSKILEGKNLRLVSQGEAKTKSERYLVAKSYEQLENNGRLITSVLGLLHATQKRPDWSNLRKHLQRRYPGIFSQFSRFDEDGFKTVGKEPFEIWNQGAKGKALDESNVLDETITTVQDFIHKANRNVHGLSTLERRRLVELWVQQIHENKTDELFELVKGNHNIQKQLENIHDEVDRRVLQTADVIGVTSTGLAKRISVFKHCKVFIWEEAGEVMEPHIISGLLPSVEHLIQIGDHEQLRPQINNYGLSLESRQGTPYQLDRSQFERLSVGEPGRPSFHVAQLNVQRRMRPEISTLIRNTIYPRLIDHKTTKNLPDVVGMRKNVFWLDHKNLEEVPDADRHQKSRSNDWEVDMTHALVRHIVRQGVYSSSDIAVLTPYTGQLQKLRKKMQSDFQIVLSDRDEETLARDGFKEETAATEEDRTSTRNKRKSLKKKRLSEFLRIATVDNFQGEESKIIIISLVRSNKEKKVGFLRTTNRINVLLSRAQHGMYLIGNTDTYSNISMWTQVIRMLEATDSVGNAFGLCCPRHTDTVMQAFEPFDFERLSPEGGCQLSCDRRLTECGHKCLTRCHSDTMHDVFKCPQPCQRLHTPCNHGCQKQTCGENCGLCMMKLDNVHLPCNHLKDEVPCYQAQDPGSIKCNVRVQKAVPGCNHTVEVPCFQDVDTPSFRCPTACGIKLACGHRCPGTCGRCNGKDADMNLMIKHQKCTKICGTCNHTCQSPCHDGTDSRYMFDALILNVLYDVTNPVHRAWRAAPGPANTRGDANLRSALQSSSM